MRMLRRSILVFALLGLLPQGVSAGVNRWTSHGPYGGEVSFLIDPKTPSTVYATGVNGIFRSTDGAATWEPTGWPGTILAISASDPRVLYTDQGRTGDGGVTWTPLTQPVPPDPSFHTSYSIVALAIDPIRSGTIYAGVNRSVVSDFGSLQAQIYKSTDGGASWALSLSKGELTMGSPNIWLSALAVDSDHPPGIHVVFATSGGQTIYNSADGGSTWNPATVGFQPATLNLASGPPGMLYAGTYGGGAFRSSDAGVNWLPINEGFDPDALSQVFVAPAASDASVIFASTAAGVFRSNDAGSHWLPTNPAIKQGVLAVDPQDSSRLYSSGSHDEVLKSTDGGFRWAQADAGLTSLYLEGVAVDPRDLLTVFASVGGGVAKTTDGGAHWSIFSSGLPARPHVKVVVVDPRNSAMLYATTDFSGVFRSEDAGSTWIARNTGLPDPAITGSVVIDPQDSNVLLVGTDQGVFKTQNGGQLWQAANSGLVGPGVGVVAVDGSVAFAATAEGLLRSLDAAASWTPTPLTQEIRSLVIDSADSSHILAATATGVFVSSDTGQSWSPTGLTTPSDSLSLDPRGTGAIYASSEGLILRSADGGQTWTPAAPAFPGKSYPGVPSYWGAFVLDSTGTRIYAAARVGIFDLEFRETRSLPPRPVATAAARELVH